MFPHRLFLALESAAFCGSISWTTSGDSWRILNLDSFFANVLPVFTGGSSMVHFNRFVGLLNIWGFQQIQHGPNASAFHNPFFLRGRHSLLKQLVPSASQLACNLKSTSSASQTSQQLFQKVGPSFTNCEKTFPLERRLGIQLTNNEAKTVDSSAGSMPTSAYSLQNATKCSTTVSGTDGERNKTLPDRSQWLLPGEAVAFDLDLDSTAVGPWI